MKVCGILLIGLLPSPFPPCNQRDSEHLFSLLAENPSGLHLTQGKSPHPSMTIGSSPSTLITCLNWLTHSAPATLGSAFALGILCLNQLSLDSPDPLPDRSLILLTSLIILPSTVWYQSYCCWQVLKLLVSCLPSPFLGGLERLRNKYLDHWMLYLSTEDCVTPLRLTVR